MQQGPEDHYNPYAPPVQGGYYAPSGEGYNEDFQMLASRGARLGARIIDALLAVASAVPFFVALFSSVETTSSASYDAVGSGAGLAPDPFGGVFTGLVMAMILPILALQFYQWYLIAKDGQTLGKRWLGIKIVKQGGMPVDFVSGVILREWVLGAAGAIPYIGNFVGFIDAVMIFGDQQLCLHDHIAKTKVIMKLNQV